jgi:ethanolamine-phosphate cytidylyltransferase
LLTCKKFGVLSTGQTANFIQLFSHPTRARPKGAKVVYIDGAWDMFHAGHIATLKTAKAKGDYLIVGVFNDELVNRHRGANMPILNLNERVLSVLACKHVDDVLIDAPWVITEQVLHAPLRAPLHGLSRGGRSADAQVAGH